MEDEADDSGAAASLLALHAMVTWLVRREIERASEARAGLLAHVEIAMAAVVRRDPDLLGAAQAACASVARAAGASEAPAGLQ